MPTTPVLSLPSEPSADQTSALLRCGSQPIRREYGEPLSPREESRNRLLRSRRHSSVPTLRSQPLGAPRGLCSTRPQPYSGSYDAHRITFDRLTEAGPVPSPAFPLFLGVRKDGWKNIRGPGQQVTDTP